MFNKKKTHNHKKATNQKKKAYKSSDVYGETINTTKQKTYATLQQTNEPNDHKISTRTTHFSSRREYIDQMQANKLSPFSSPGKSLSPRRTNSVSPSNVNQQTKKRKKKIKRSEITLQCRKITNKSKKNRKMSKEGLNKEKDTKIQFENQFLKRMSRVQGLQQKKITELSEQSIQGSIYKKDKPFQLKISIHKNRQPLHRKPKNNVFYQMHKKIKVKYSRMYPKLSTAELKVLCAVVLIQRIWRQKKVKDMIGDFLSPNLFPKPFEVSYGETISNGLKKYHSKINHQNHGINAVQNTMKTDHQIETFLQKNQLINKECYTPVRSKDNSSQLINLKSLQLSDGYSDESARKQQRIVGYINMYREVTLMKKKNKLKKNRNRPNIFSIPQSFSEKCLLDTMYRQNLKKVRLPKVSKKQIQTYENFIFPSRSCEKLKQHFASPKKPEVVQLQERFYTQAQDQDYQNQQNSLIKVSQPLKPQEQTLGNISQIAQATLKMLLQQFSDEFLSFSTKKCLKKKKRTPGIKINRDTISEYLNNFIAFIQKNHQNHIGTSLKKITATSFLKIFRIFPQEDLFISYSSRQYDSESQQDQFSWPILPTNAFFQYQPLYEQETFIIKQQDSKYSNFLLGLIKIHNKCLVDCLSEYIQKTRVDSFVFPWDSTKTQQFLQAHAPTQNSLAQIIRDIVSISQTKLGVLRPSIRGRDFDQQQNSLLASLRQQYRKQGRQWNNYSQLLQIRLELTQGILEDIWLEACQDILKTTF